MAEQLAGHVMDLDLNGTAFTDEVYNSVGAAAFSFRELAEADGHDFFTQEDLIIRTASGGGGTLLVENTDYVLSEEDTDLSTRCTAAYGATRHVYKKCQVTNAAYQAIDLYVSGEWIGDGVDANFYNSISQKVVTKNADYTITDTDGYAVFLCDSGTDGIIMTLPTAADNKNRILTFIQTNLDASVTKIDGEGSETINGLTHIFLCGQYNKIDLIGNGSGWNILHGNLFMDSGWISCSDWTSRHLGFQEVDVDNASNPITFIVGETVTESTTGNTGVIIKITDNLDTTGTLTLILVTGTGIFTNNETLTGNQSADTADINEVTGSTKNLDSNIYHGWATNMINIKKQFSYSIDGTEANATEMIEAHNSGSGGNIGVAWTGVDTNNIKLQTGVDGLHQMVDNAQVGLRDTDDDYYKIKINWAT